MSTSSIQEIVAVFGQPVAGNPTQYMMEKAFAAAGLDWRYLTLEVSPDNLPDAVQGLRAMGFRGGNLTIPHKVSVIPLLDGLSEAADLCGAVNCMNRDGDKLLGENTDGKGFVRSLREATDPQDKRIVLFGAGGAARAISVELGLAGVAHITVVNRTMERGQELVDLLNNRVKVAAEYIHWQGDYDVPVDTDVVINGTSIGLGDAESRVPVNVQTLLPNMVVADVMFNPYFTRLLREAQAQGCKTLDGLGMLVNQGVFAFKVWTGVDPDPQVMRDALEEFVSM